MRVTRMAALFCGSVCLSLSLPAQARLPTEARVPGGVAVLALAPVSTGGEKPHAWFAEQPVWVASRQGQWFAVVGLPLDLPPGPHELRVEVAGENRSQRFEVAAKDYPVQRITLKDTSKVQLSADDLARVEAETAAIQRIKRHWRDASDTDPDFVLPAQGRPTGRFGLRRFFNGEARSPHAGFDIAAARGTVVKANAQGLVLATGDFFFNGKTVFVDHGNGLITMYCHLDRIDAQEGERLVQGQPLGLSGMTGRATGPHLHWSVILNGAMVNPELFISPAGKTR